MTHDASYTRLLAPLYGAFDLFKKVANMLAACARAGIDKPKRSPKPTERR